MPSVRAGAAACYTTGERLVIRPVSVDEVFDAEAFKTLRDEYEAEASRDHALRGREPDREGYAALVQAGLMAVLGAFVDGRLVGVATVLFSPVLHAGGKLIAVTETLFVRRAYRAGGVGLRLLRAAEAVAAEHGAEGLYVSAPADGVLERVLPRLGYRKTNTVFCRSFA
jgi:GNAT superfamily N-acetyltransferase